MRAVVACSAALAVLLAGAGCARDAARPSPGTGDGRPSASASAPTSVLDGTWAATITRKAYLDYLADHGVRRRAALAAAERDHPGESFSARFAEGMFNVTGPTGESWHQGDFEVRGNELHLWDDGFREAGIPPFRLLLDRVGNSIRLEVAPGQDDMGDHIPGVPGLVAGGALWCPAPWVKVS